jgi:hypothetical protein
MPAIVHGNVDGKKGDFSQVEYDYDYPNELSLKPGSEFHNMIRSKIIERATTSSNAMKMRYDSWNKVDHVLTAYIPADVEEGKVKAKDSRKPISIVFPYSYAMMESLMAYLMTAFGQEPIFRYEGVSPEDTVGAMLLELVVQLHCNKTKVPLALHTFFRDSLAYGLGIAAPGWEVKRGQREVFRPGAVYDMNGQLANERGYRDREETVLFEGNELTNIDPYRYLPDPNVGAHEIQKGEFVGWLVKDNLMNLLREEQYDEDMFNVRYLKHVQNPKSQFVENPDERTRKTMGGTVSPDSTDTNRVDLLYMYIDLIPKDWKLSESEDPERWCFCLAGDTVVVKAYKTNFNHGMFPVAVAAPDFDGYSPTPMSRLEILYGLQEVLDFLFNSHVANVRKAVNDMIIVDPQLVNINDLKDPKPGKLIRLRRPAWGRGVKDVAMQLGINDITRANIADSSYIVNWMQKIAATDDPMMGSLRQGGPERLTKGEFQGTQAMGYSRLARIAQIIGYQGMQDIGYQFATHVQQLMDRETYIRATGRWQQALMAEFGVQPGGRVKVTPFDLLVEYDMFVRDGSVPGSNFSEAWLQLFNILAGSEELMQQFDMTRIFMHIARSLGAKNVEDFKRNVNQVQPTVAPDQQVLQQAQAGNLVPMAA